MTVRAYFIKGLGGTFGLYDAGIKDVRSDLVSMPGVRDGGMYTYPQRDYLVAQIRNDRAVNSSLKIAVLGHSLGAVTAMSVTDYLPVDFVVLFDVAGGVPSRVGKNTKLCFDMYDVAADMVPEWRPQAVPGYESRIKQYRGALGHVQCPFNKQWRAIIKSEMAILAK